MQKHKSKIIVLITAILLTLLIILFKEEASPFNSKDQKTRLFEVKSGESLISIADNLRVSGLIKNSTIFVAIVRLNGLGNKLEAGDYDVSPNMTPLEIAKTLRHGTKDIWVTILEGWRIEEIADELNNKLGIDKESFIKLAKEGYMFPDTYRFPASPTVESVVKIFLDNFDQKVRVKVSDRLASEGKSLDEVLILASIVEREANNDVDRPIVAGILLKRMKNGWPLEVDATIQYALGFQNKEKTWWKKDLTADDLAIISPFNSRKNPGLPPSPICSPGLSSILAVITPQESPYWYYLSDSKSGMHYSVTLEEHNAQIQKYL